MYDIVRRLGCPRNCSLRSVIIAFAKASVTTREHAPLQMYTLDIHCHAIDTLKVSTRNVHLANHVFTPQPCQNRGIRSPMR